MTQASTTAGAPIARALIGQGEVRHQRLRPARHGFAYPTFFVLLPMRRWRDDPQAGGGLARNRRGLIAFHDADHGDGREDSLAWLESMLAAEGVADADGEVWLHCYPRVLGYAFKPVSFWYAHRLDGSLAAVVAEVNNTFGERHTYLIPVEHSEAGAIRQACDKQFYVSPFMPVAGRYDFKVEPPGETLGLVINYGDDAGLLLHASFRGRRMPLDDRGLLRAAIRYPLMTFKVIAGIHWEAAKLWRKRVPLIDRPPPPAYPVTVVRANEP